MIKAIKSVFERLVSKFRYKDNGLWVFGEWFGERCCDNAMYLANYVAKNHPEIECVWIAKESADLSGLDPRVRVLVKNLEETDRIVKNAHILVMNQGFCDLSDTLSYISGPVTINLWHGVPWKRIGLDGIRTSALRRKYYMIQLRLMSPQYFVSLSDDFTQILCSSCGARMNRIIKTGYPRNSFFYQMDDVSSCRTKLLEHLSAKYSLSGNMKDCRIITYMPTFRDGSKEQFSFMELIGNKEFEELLVKHNVFVVQKAHFVSKGCADDSKADRILMENDYPAQELLAATDILVTDYSSCFFDYLLLDRPIIHYIYDYEFYATENRGLYYKKEEVACGDAVETKQELVESIKKYLEDPSCDSELRRERSGKYMKYESPESCREIFNYLRAIR